jgi:toxin ParE1/3/4
LPEYRFTPAAQRDLEGIFDHSVRQWGLMQALQYTQALESALVKLAESPAQGQDCDRIRNGYRRRLVARHFVYFQAADYGISIVRILHARMDAPRHLAGKLPPVE